MHLISKFINYSVKQIPFAFYTYIQLNLLKLLQKSIKKFQLSTCVDDQIAKLQPSSKYFIIISIAQNQINYIDSVQQFHQLDIALFLNFYFKKKLQFISNIHFSPNIFNILKVKCLKKIYSIQNILKIINRDYFFNFPILSPNIFTQS